MNMVEDSFDYSTFSLNRERLLKSDHSFRRVVDPATPRDWRFQATR